jgi:Flp pilus assembly pilin Flp
MHLRTAAQDKTAMASLLHCFWSEDDGVLSFEWTLLVTLLAIGVVGGLAGARDAVMDELGDVAEAMLALDGTYTIAYPLELQIAENGGAPVVVGRASDSGFFDVLIVQDCARVTTEIAPVP